MRVEAIIFDMDGLLINSEPLWREAEKKVFGQLGLTLNEEELRATTGIRLDEVVRIRYAQKPWNDLSLRETEAVITEEVISGINRGIPLLPGVQQVLDQVNSSGLPCAIASSSPLSIINAAVKYFSWQTLIPIIQSAEGLELGKPHPEVYINAAASLKTPPNKCLAFEDSIPGVIAAKAAQMITVAVPDHEFRGHPGFGIADLTLKTIEEFKLEDWLK
ncbi:MAG: HAD superfamily hydrolase (TIGR01509 family) [Limisphaerales bacterium]|jgi:HAD superfamily hydrolase (TIGR01509 family)